MVQNNWGIKNIIIAHICMDETSHTNVKYVSYIKEKLIEEREIYRSMQRKGGICLCWKWSLSEAQARTDSPKTMPI